MASSFYDDIMLRARRGLGKTSLANSSTKSRGERVWKSLSSTGSAMVKRIPGAGVQHPKQLAGQLAYVNGKAKGVFGFATGVTCDGDAFEHADLDEMMAQWSADWKGRPRNGHTSHMVLSMPDDVSHGAAFMIAREWCAEMFESQTHIKDSWEYVAALHTDTDNPHVHVVLNNRGVDGTWFSISKMGVFNPQMMRDRMTDIADTYGVQLDSLTRADRGLYKDPITSAELFATREGRTIDSAEQRESLSADWRKKDMMRTAQLYTTLADFAEAIGAPMIAQRAYLSAAALFAGNEVPKGQQMEIDLDVTADREDIRTSIISWAQQNQDQIDALPTEERVEIMAKIDTALNIIETDIAPDVTEDVIWAGYKETPTAYLIHDVGALQARAALYVDEDQVRLLHAFVGEQVLDTYLVTGEVPAKFADLMPAVAEAYEEMHNHRLSEIPKEMKTYVQKATNLGLDPRVMQERLIKAIDDPEENLKIEREDISRIVEKRGASLADPDAISQADADYRALQMDLGKVEEKIIADSVVVDRDGFALVIQDAASTAQTTGRADLADSDVGRHILRSFVALEGKRVMQDLARGKMDSLAEYIDTPAQQKLAARELLKSAKTMDVGLELDQIEDGLEAVDPAYSRSSGISL